MLRRLPPLIGFLAALVALHFAVFAAFRVVFWIVFREASANAAATDLLKAFYIGFKFDLRLALLLALPVAVLGWLAPLDPARSLRARRFWTGLLALALGVVLFAYFVDFGHYAYVRMRLNATLLDHLTPIGVAARVAWDTYPVLPGISALLALTGSYAWLVSRTAQRTLAPVTNPLPRWPRRGALVLCGLLYAFGIFGKWSWYPLRWSEAYFSPNEAVAALALNPVLFLQDTYANRGQPYDIAKVRDHQAALAAILGSAPAAGDSPDFARHVPPRTVPGPRRNLVVIHLESFAAFKAGAFGNRLDATPNFDALVKEGALFTNFFVPAVPTARSVFTMLSGIPDVNPSTSASRNPFVIGQHTLINALAGHDKYYFLGGSATWGNIRGLFTRNIPDVRMFEEGDYDVPETDAWGVSDDVLLDKAHAVFSANAKPFFAFVQTAGNHRPFALPKDLRGFKLAQMDDATLKASGFDSIEAYNGLRFFDYALGLFFAQARRADYFRNTVFVMYGDHGNPSTQTTPWEELRLTGYHVPLLIIAPGLIEPGRRLDFTASLPDVLPTSLGLIGAGYLNTTLGRDLFSLPPGAAHFSLIGTNGILDDEFYLRRDPDRVRLFRYRTPEGARDVAAQNPERAADLLRLQEAIYEAARYLLHHNSPRSVTAPPVRERAAVQPKGSGELQLQR